MLATYACGTISFIATVAGVLEGFGAIYWRRRAGHWHAHRVAGVLLCLCVGALFAGLAIT